MIMPPRKKLQGVDDELLKLLDANMDGVAARRRAREAFKRIQLGVDHILFKVFGPFLFFIGFVFVHVTNVFVDFG